MYPYRHQDVIQHVSRTGDRYVVRLVDESTQECYAENLDGGYGTRVINLGNWVKVGVLVDGEVR